MDASRLERAARVVVDDFPFLTMRDAMKRAQASGSERVPCFLNREHLEALEALRDALDAAPEPANAMADAAWFERELRILLRDVAVAVAIESPDDKNYSGFTIGDAHHIAMKVLDSRAEEIADFISKATTAETAPLSADQQAVAEELAHLGKCAVALDAAMGRADPWAKPERDTFKAALEAFGHLMIDCATRKRLAREGGA